MTSEPGRRPDGGGWRAELAWGTGLALLTVLVYHDTLTYWWTGPDTFTLIATSRLDSLGDLWYLLTQPMMAGSGFTEIGHFFRPVTGLSFALDWVLWGFDPTGYHVTNLLLHAAAVVLTYLLALRLTGGARGASVLAAALFSVHPMVAESLPAISRRQDALATVLLLASLLAYLRSRRGGDRAPWALAASLSLGFLAFGAKEVALVLPALIAAHAWLLDPQAPGSLGSRERLGWAVTRAGPHLAIWVVFLAWRTWVLGGLGGYVGRPGLISGLVAWNQGQFITSLLPPLRYVQITLALPGEGVTVLLGTTLVGLAGLTVLVYRARWTKLRGDLAGLAATDPGRATGFCLLWLLAGFTLFLAARTFTLWSAYQFLIPSSIAVATLLSAGLAHLVRPRLMISPQPRPHRPAVVAGTLLLAGIVITSVVLSPGVRGEQDWEINGEVQRALLPALSDELDAADGEVAVLHAETLTWYHSLSWGKPDRVETVFYFQHFTMEDWLYLDSGGTRQVDVISQGEGVLERWPADLSVQLEPRGAGQAELVILDEVAG